MNKKEQLKEEIAKEYDSIKNELDDMNSDKANAIKERYSSIMDKIDKDEFDFKENSDDIKSLQEFLQAIDTIKKTAKNTYDVVADM